MRMPVVSDRTAQEAQLVEWLADIDEDRASELAKRMVLELCRSAMDIVGQIDETVRAYTGADAFGVNAVEAVTLSKSWMGAAA
jgi:hypothetical protein